MKHVKLFEDWDDNEEYSQRRPLGDLSRVRRLSKDAREQDYREIYDAVHSNLEAVMQAMHQTLGLGQDTYHSHQDQYEDEINSAREETDPSDLYPALDTTRHYLFVMHAGDPHAEDWVAHPGRELVRVGRNSSNIEIYVAVESH